MPKDWTRDELTELASEFRQSIGRRQQLTVELGEHGAHRTRINDEISLLRQIEKTLGGS